jgi:hypothetical protein
METVWEVVEIRGCMRGFKTDEVMDNIECFNFSLGFGVNRQSDVITRHESGCLQVFISTIE